MNQQQSSSISLNPCQIIKAFEVIADNGVKGQQIKKADRYLSQCQINQKFILMLIMIFKEIKNEQTKYQILILLKNIIMRNWVKKNNQNFITTINFKIKEEVREELIGIYRNSWKLYYKQFNQIFKYLARQDFPNNYELLNKFVGEILLSLVSIDISQMLQSQQILPYLSLVKVIYKEYAERRMSHSEEDFNKFIAQPVKLVVSNLQKVNLALVRVRECPQSIDIAIIKRLFECSRKLDKILFYSLRSMVASMQYNESIIAIIKFQISKLQNLQQLRSAFMLNEIDLNILAILEGISNIQTLFPLLFASFLYHYLDLIISLLFKFSSPNSKLTNCIIRSNIVPLTTFSYYTQTQQFSQSLQYKIDKNRQANKVSQQNCSKAFKAIYNSNNIMIFLQKIVGELMNHYQRSNQDDQIMFEDADGCNDQGSFQLVIIFIKTIMELFQYQSNIFINKIIQYLINQDNNNYKITINMYEVILLMPKIFGKNLIDVNSIFALIQKCHRTGNFDLFCRLIRIFHEFFKEEAVTKCFEALLAILSTDNLRHHTIYQIVVCITKLMSRFENMSLPHEKFEPCLSKIMNLMQIYKDIPSHLWNLLNLVNKILRQLKTSAIMDNLHYIVQNVNMLVEMPNNGSLIIAALGQLLNNILCLVDADSQNYYHVRVKLYNVSLNLIENIQKNNELQECQQQIKTSMYQLLLSTIRDIHISSCPQQLKNRLIKIMSQLKEDLLNQNPPLFFQVLEEYLLSGVLQIKVEDLVSLCNQQIRDTEPGNDILSHISYFSLYYTYTILTKNLISELLQVSIKKLKDLMAKSSPSINSLRSQLMLLINYHVLIYGGDKIFQIFNIVFRYQYLQWFWPYIWSLDYINNIYSKQAMIEYRKIITIGILQSINTFKNILLNKVQQNLPIDYILKFISYFTEPINIDQIMAAYQNAINQFSNSYRKKQKIKRRGWERKTVLHVNSLWAQFDARQIYKENIGSLLIEWDWDVDDLRERFSEELVAKIGQLLNLNQRIVS